MAIEYLQNACVTGWRDLRQGSVHPIAFRAVLLATVSLMQMQMSSANEKNRPSDASTSYLSSTSATSMTDVWQLPQRTDPRQ